MTTKQELGRPGVKATLYTLLIRRDEDGRGSGLLSWYFEKRARVSGLHY
jgi:hypothetical protein